MGSKAVVVTSMCLLAAPWLGMSGCAAVHQVPVLSIVVDLQEMRQLSAGMWLDEVSDADLRELASRPVPAPPGLSFDVGMGRRAIALMALGDREGVLEAYKQTRRHGGDLSREIMVGLVAATETWVGNTESALRLFGEVESAWIASGKRDPAGILAVAGREATICTYLNLAIDTNPGVAERLIRTYPPDLDSSARHSMEARLNYWFHFQTARAHLAAKTGDFEQAYAMLVRMLAEYRARRARAESQDPQWADKEEVFQKWLTLYSLGLGRYSQAKRHLDEYEAMRRRAGHVKMGASRYHAVRAEYFAAMGAYEHAVQAWDAAWSTTTRVERHSTFNAAILLTTKARYQVAARDFSGAVHTLSNTALPGRLENNIVRDIQVSLGAYARAMTGDAGQDLRALDAIDGNLSKRLGPSDELWPVAAKVVAYQRRGDATGSLEDLVQAVKGGRQFSSALRKLRAAAFNHQGLVPKSVVEAVSEAYLLAVIAAIDRNGASIDDLIDAFGLAQVSATDADISAAAMRRERIPEISADDLRRLQDLQQAARSAREKFAMLSRASDADPARLEALRGPSDEADRLLERHLAALQESSPALRQAMVVQKHTVRDLTSRLGRDEVLAVFAPTRSGTVVLLVGAREVGYRLVPLTAGRAARLTRLILASVTIDPASGPPAFDVGAARELHDALLGWAPRIMKSAKSLSVVAGDPLGKVPLGLLVRGAPAARTPGGYRDVPWLVKSMAIAHSPSISSWAAITGDTRRVRSGSYIAWADPDYGGRELDPSTAAVRTVRQGLRSIGAGAQDKNDSGRSPPLDLGALLPRLPETRLEAQEVARVLGASPADDVITGGYATRSSVLRISDSGGLAYKSVVMFATHGLAPRQIAGLHQPALAMAREAEGTEPALLQLEDVIRLQMNADWVILSACNTASADGIDSEMLSGLARGFFFAGARSLLVTHWAVESESAAAVTVKTMQHYAADSRTTRAQAVRKASLDLIERRGTRGDWSHPAFWAAFSLVGHAGR